MGIKGRETVTILRTVYGVSDDYGNPLETQVTVPISGCLIGWGSNSQSESLYQTRQDTEATILFPNGTQIEDDDKFLLPNGDKYEINGEPIKWKPQAGSPIRTKVLVEVKHSDG